MGKIKELPLIDRPREKAYKYGVNTLSDYELLAIILQSGCKDKSALEISIDLILKFKGLNNLFNTSFNELIKCDGISKVKALTFLVIKELFIRFSQSKMLIDDNIKLSSANDVYNYANLKYTDLNAEKVVAYYLNNKNIIIYEQILSIGDETTSILNSKLICKVAIEKYAKKVLLSHNHPSGNSSPSIDDISSFINLKKALSIINVKLLDHVILGKNEYYSILDEIKFFVD